MTNNIIFETRELTGIGRALEIKLTEAREEIVKLRDQLRRRNLQIKDLKKKYSDCQKLVKVLQDKNYDLEEAQIKR